MALTLKPWTGSSEEIYQLLVNTSWVKSYGGRSTFDYTPEFLDWYCKNPIAQPDDKLALYDGDKLVGYCITIRRKYLLKGKIIDGLFITGLSINPDKSKKGYGSTMTLEIIKKYQAENKKHGTPEVLSFFNDDDRPTSRIFPKANREAGTFLTKLAQVNLFAKVFSVEKLKNVEDVKWYESISMSVIGRFGAPKQSYSDQLKQYERKHLDDCLSLINEIAPKQDFCPVFEKEELHHYLQYKNFSNTVVFEAAGQVVGFIQYRLIPLTGKGTKEIFGFIDWVCDQKMDRPQAKSLLNFCLTQMKDSGAIAAMYCDLPALRESKIRSSLFLPYPRKVFLSTSVFDENKVNFNDVKRSYEPLA